MRFSATRRAASPLCQANCSDWQTRELTYSKRGAFGRMPWVWNMGASVVWTLPVEGWWKVNTDGYSKGNPGSAGGGGIIRDHMGNWIAEFLVNIDHCDSMLAECWEAFYGLKLAWDRGLRKLVLEIDSQLVTGWLSRVAECENHYHNIIADYKELLSRD